MKVPLFLSHYLRSRVGNIHTQLQLLKLKSKDANVLSIVQFIQDKLIVEQLARGDLLTVYELIKGNMFILPQNELMENHPLPSNIHISGNSMKLTKKIQKIFFLLVTLSFLVKRCLLTIEDTKITCKLETEEHADDSLTNFLFIYCAEHILSPFKLIRSETDGVYETVFIFKSRR